MHPPLLPRALRERAEPWRAERPRTVGWAIAACLAAPTRDAARASARSTRAQFLFYEDLDLCLRARAAGVPTVLRPGRRASATPAATRPGRAYGGEPHALLAAPPPRGGRARAAAARRAGARRRRAGAHLRHPRGRARVALRRPARTRARAARGAARRDTKDRVSSIQASTDRVVLRALEPLDREEFLALVRESRDLHRPWAYPPERADQFDELLARARRDDFVCLLACRAQDGAIAGVFTISQIVRGAFQSRLPRLLRPRRHAGQGYMRDGLELVARPRLRAARACTASRPTSSRATPPRSRSRAAPASGSRASPRATC